MGPPEGSLPNRSKCSLDVIIKETLSEMHHLPAKEKSEPFGRKKQLPATTCILHCRDCLREHLLVKKILNDLVMCRTKISRHNYIA